MQKSIPAHIDTNSQPTKEMKRDVNQQTTKHIHTYKNKHLNDQTTKVQLRVANTNTNSRGRVLPAAGSPKEPFRL